MHSLRFWADTSEKVYGPRERSRFIGGFAYQMRQLEAALKELDQEDRELVSASISMAFFGRQGFAVLRRQLSESRQNTQ